MLKEDANTHDALIKAIRSARIVLLGEASHGVHEFYGERALITDRKRRVVREVCSQLRRQWHAAPWERDTRTFSLQTDEWF